MAVILVSKQNQYFGHTKVFLHKLEPIYEQNAVFVQLYGGEICLINNSMRYALLCSSKEALSVAARLTMHSSIRLLHYIKSYLEWPTV